MRYAAGFTAAITMLLWTAVSHSEPGFDPRYERDYNIFNSVTKYHPDNPLNPVNKYDPDNAFNPVNQYDPGNPTNPINQYNPNNPFNSINRYHPDNPLNPVNKFNLTFPVARYGVGLSFREVFGIEFCDTPQLAAGSFIPSVPFAPLDGIGGSQKQRW